MTIDTYQHACLFGKIVDGRVQLSPAGKIVAAEWQHLPFQFPTIQLDAFVIMPDHVHGIILISEENSPVNKTNSTNTNEMDHSVTHEIQGDFTQPKGPAPGSLGAIIGQFKSRVTKRIWAKMNDGNISIWQRNYYERIIRDQAELERVRTYIIQNPIRANNR